MAASMGRARAWQAAGTGLSNIGQILTRQRAQDEEQRRYAEEERRAQEQRDSLLSLTVTERGGGMGELPTRAATPGAPGTAATMLQESDVGALDSDLSRTYIPPTLATAPTPAGPDTERYVPVAGGRAYVMRPDRRPDALLAQERERRAADLDAARAEAYRTAAAENTANAGRLNRAGRGDGRPTTYPQALDRVMKSHIKYDEYQRPIGYTLDMNAMDAMARRIMAGDTPDVPSSGGPTVTPRRTGTDFFSGLGNIGSIVAQRDTTSAPAAAPGYVPFNSPTGGRGTITAPRAGAPAPGPSAQEARALLDQITTDHPDWSDDQIRAEARRQRMR